MEIFILTALLCLMFSLYLLSTVINDVPNNKYLEVNITLYLQQKISPQEVDRIRTQLENLPIIKNVDVHDKKTVYNFFKKQEDFKSIIAQLQDNPFPTIMTATTTINHASSINDHVNQIQSWPEITQARYDAPWVMKVSNLYQKIRIFLLSTLGMLSMIFLLLISLLTIKSISFDREEVDLSYWLGATTNYLNRAYLFYTVFSTLISGSLSICLVGLSVFLNNNAARILSDSIGNVSPMIFFVSHAGAFMATALLASWLSTLSTLFFFKKNPYEKKS